MGGMSGTDWVARRPAPALRPLIDSYIGYRIAMPSGGPMVDASGPKRST